MTGLWHVCVCVCVCVRACVHVPDQVDSNSGSTACQLICLSEDQNPHL
jgi:hypothetical protein